MFNKVFISYAREDIEHAMELYSFLISNKYEPWMDKKNLRVGDNWDFKTKQSLKNSDFIIILLSSNSITKKGYFQREFKLALQYFEEKPFDDIYILPVLLDDCEIPEPLNKIQWLKYEGKAIFIEILESLNKQQKNYREAPIKPVVDKPPVNPKSIGNSSKKRTAGKSRKYILALTAMIVLLILASVLYYFIGQQIRDSEYKKIKSQVDSMLLSVNHKLDSLENVSSDYKTKLKFSQLRLLAIKQSGRNSLLKDTGIYTKLKDISNTIILQK